MPNRISLFALLGIKRTPSPQYDYELQMPLAEFLTKLDAARSIMEEHGATDITVSICIDGGTSNAALEYAGVLGIEEWADVADAITPSSPPARVA